MFRPSLLLRLGLLLAALHSLGQSASAQRVGIGTTAPTQTLDVKGLLRVRGLAGVDRGLLSPLADGTLQAQATPYLTPVPASYPVPVYQMTVPTNGDAQDLVVNPAGTRAFVINAGTGMLQTFDLTTPGRPRSISSVKVSINATSLCLNAAGTRLYVAAGYEICVFDVNSGVPTNQRIIFVPAISRMLMTDPADTRLFVVTNHIYNSAEFLLLECTLDNTGMGLGRNYAEGQSITQGIALNPANGQFYLLEQDEGTNASNLAVYQVGTGASPAVLGKVPTGLEAQALAVNAAGTLAYVLNGADNTLQLFRISGSDLPVSLGTVPTGRRPRELALNAAGTRLYVTCADDHVLQTFDVSGPGLPVRLGSAPTGLNPVAVATHPARAEVYVLNGGQHALQVFGLSNAPQLLGVGAAAGLGAVPVPGAGRLPVAAGTVSSVGTLVKSTAPCTVTQLAPGTYRLRFATSPLSLADLSQVVPVATLTGSAPGSVSCRPGVGYLDVFTFAPGGAAADRGFSFSISLP